MSLRCPSPAQLQWWLIRATMRTLLTGRLADTKNRRSTAFGNTKCAGGLDCQATKGIAASQLR
jgi:hypothetical protein